MEEELAPAEPGMYRLKNDPAQTRFILTGEISTIYKQGDKVRKVHHVIGAPDLAAAKKIGALLAKVGNILSDGRPILGITSRNLLEIVLEASPDAFLIPAHIWTPWFSVLGSKSGFDTIKECYLDLEPHIFAVETGLSSDPPMNWMVKSLDRYHLISNSDAHSVEKLGREATVFETGFDYYAIYKAMATGVGLLGTVEFFPEEGKYHLDGHRDCGVVVMPEQTREYKGICPVCGKPLTVGVLNRVEELADRPGGERPKSARHFYSLIPLTEILSEMMHVASPTKKVMALAEKLTGQLGGELPLLLDADLDEIKSVAGETLALAVKRMRLGEVDKEAGYDGKFGRVRVFKDNEQDMLFAKGLIDAPVRRKGASLGKKKTEAAPVRRVMLLNDEQRSAVAWEEGPIVVMAGPGTGKTRVLVERIRQLIDKGETPSLAVTFTNRAAKEIRDRLDWSDSENGKELYHPGTGITAPTTLPSPPKGWRGASVWTSSPSTPAGGRGRGEGDEPLHVEVSTFHSLAARIMHDAGMSFEIADEAMLEKIASPAIERDVKKWVDDLIFRQGTGQALEGEQAALIELMKSQGVFTYEGLIAEAERLVSSGTCEKRFIHVMVDEFQDINPLQYTFLKALSKGARSVMVIGDPNQAIYGFRGSSKASFDDFIQDSPHCTKIHLSATHRLGANIACASNAFIGNDAVCSQRETSPIRVVRTDRPYDFIAHEIEALSGGLTHLSVGKAKGEYALSDMAIIVRTKSQAMPVMEALARASIPHDTAYAGPFALMRGIRERIGLLVGRLWEPSVKGVGEQALKCIQSGLEPAGHVQDKIKLAKAFLEGLTGSVSARVTRIDASDLFRLPALDALSPFYQYAQLFDDNVGHFVEFLKLSNDQSALGAEKVHVITAHAAKGLEFRCVFMAGLMQGVFPLSGSSIEEERNLFYVAMTRAKDLLYLVCPQSCPSEFVGRIPEMYAVETAEKHRKTKPGQMVLFD
jgi:DNA helicase-2/ATP-dependent DNA helicase PcrA